jgi:hypothetical protein
MGRIRSPPVAKYGKTTDVPGARRTYGRAMLSSLHADLARERDVDAHRAADVARAAATLGAKAHRSKPSRIAASDRSARRRWRVRPRISGG